MNKMSKAEELKERIAELQLLHTQEKEDLKKHLHAVRDALKPANILKNTFKEVTASPDIKNKFIGAVLGLAAGYLAKKAIFGKSSGALKKVAGNLVQMGIAGTVSQGTDKLRSLGGGLVKRFMDRIRKKHNGVAHNGQH